VRRRRSGGQASVEAIAAVPIVVAVVLMAWQLAVLVRGAIVAHEHLRIAAAAAQGRGTLTVTSTVAVPALLPGLGTRIRIAARGVVAAP
jgi:hypothetical protein